MTIPMSPPLVGVGLELGSADLPLTVGLQALGFPLSSYPSYLAGSVRSTALHPQGAPAFGVIASVQRTTMTWFAGGVTSTGSRLTYAFGVTYQQAWDRLWWRFSPNLVYPTDMLVQMAAAPPWLEVGYRWGAFEVSLRSNFTPLKVSLSF